MRRDNDYDDINNQKKKKKGDKYVVEKETN